MTIFAVCDNKDALTGLSLAGVPGKAVETAAAFENALQWLADEPDDAAGILVINKRLSAKLYEEVRAFSKSYPSMTVIEIPDPPEVFSHGK